MAETSDIQISSRGVERTERLAGLIAGHVRPGDAIALDGELGAGKTQFVRGLVVGLGGSGTLVSSPTFVLMQEYPTDPAVLHIDAYRINTLDELETLGWTDDLQADSVTLIEWADRIAADLPADRLAVHLEHTGESQRKITLRGHGGWRDRLKAVDLSEFGSGQAEKISGQCPVCGRRTNPDFLPFCSKRCRLIDLGNWLGGGYRLARPVDEADDLDALDVETEDDSIH